MKRANNLFYQIVSFENLRTAYLKARKGKTSKPTVKKFSLSLNNNLQNLSYKMTTDPPVLSKYHQFKILDPKERVISVVPFSDRVMHHAIMNVLEPIFEKQFIEHTYACRKNKGTHKAALYAQMIAKKSKWHLKLDVKKYFDSIDHNVLKQKLCRIIKDKKVLVLLFSIIDGYCTSTVAGDLIPQKSNKGLPIGNLTSQFFANLYLSSLDHYVLEKLKPVGYVRYMDDILIFANSKVDLLNNYYKIKDFCNNLLFLSLKQPIYKKNQDGITFLGWTIYRYSIKLSAKTKKRMNKKIKTIINECYQNEEEAVKRINCVLSTRKICTKNASIYLQ